MAWGPHRGSEDGALRAARPEGIAPGAPGLPGTWSYAGKSGIGTSYAPYGPQRTASRVWFSLARGIITETMYGLIHQAQLRQIKFALKAASFIAFEDEGVRTRTQYLACDDLGRPQSLAYLVITEDLEGRYEIEKRVFTDPARDCLFVRVTVRAAAGEIEPILLAEPHMGGVGRGDIARAGPTGLHACDAGAHHLVVRGALPFTSASCGFFGVSDGETELRRDGRLGGWTTTGARCGSVALAAGLGVVPQNTERAFDLVLGFGATEAAAAGAAQASLGEGYDKVLEAFNGGEGVAGWRDYLASLDALPRIAEAACDGGRLAFASALVLKAQEDKTFPGALIASLSTPWGDTVSAAVEATGYKAVWPRDFYQVASALLALGDVETPLAALAYLPTVQVRTDQTGGKLADGWFLQKTHVDGAPEWTGVQLDQTAMPIMLADKLYRAGAVEAKRLEELYALSLKPAADFLLNGGVVAFLGEKAAIAPPRTQMERWEEQEGFSPSTTAAVIAGLLAAADIAEVLGDAEAGARYREGAAAMDRDVEKTTFTTRGAYGDGRHFLRIAPRGRPNARDRLSARNGKPGLRQQAYLDAGFLELVRYGLRAPEDPLIVSSLEKVDDQTLPDRMRVRYDFTFEGEDGLFPGWRRYSDDGYGEDVRTGAGFGAVGRSGKDTPDQRGRVWPIFTGERGHYEVARMKDLDARRRAAETHRLRRVYVRAMELFANEGLMLPEQVCDGVGVATSAALVGQGTGAATPLAWSHAEYIKLLRSLADGAVWDRLDPNALGGRG